MAKQQQPPAAPKNVPYPSNWGRMSQAERRKWEETNRGIKGRPVAPPKQYPAPTAPPEPTPPQDEYPPTDSTEPSEGSEGEGQSASCLGDIRITVQVGEGEPHECAPETFLPTLLRAVAESMEVPTGGGES